jgi:capsule biosynthesis phosphatase
MVESVCTNIRSVAMAQTNYVIDIDDTIAKVDTSLPYERREPIQHVIDTINQKYKNGSKIVLFTARGMKTYGGDLNKIESAHREILEKWLVDHGVLYHELVFGKPWMENVYYVDDRAMTIDQFTAP